MKTSNIITSCTIEQSSIIQEREEFAHLEELEGVKFVHQEWSIDPCAPIQLSNVNQCCYMNSLIQCLLSSEPSRRAICATSLPINCEKSSFSLLRAMMITLEMHRSVVPCFRQIIAPTQVLEIIGLFNSRCQSTNQQQNEQVQKEPMELLEFIVSDLSGKSNHPYSRKCVR